MSSNPKGFFRNTTFSRGWRWLELSLSFSVRASSIHNWLFSRLGCLLPSHHDFPLVVLIFPFKKSPFLSILYAPPHHSSHGSSGYWVIQTAFSFVDPLPIFYVDFVGLHIVYRLSSVGGCVFIFWPVVCVFEHSYEFDLCSSISFMLCVRMDSIWISV